MKPTVDAVEAAHALALEVSAEIDEEHRGDSYERLDDILERFDFGEADGT